MYREYDQSQSYLLPPSLRDFVSEDHPAHVINDLVDQLDLSVLEARYGNLGQPAYHPRLMLKVILYGFTVGLFSSRKLERACHENLAFKYLAGMATPAFRTFIEFRQRHREDMQAVFVQTARLARELGLARLGAVALDGSKVDANTSKHKAMSYGRMQEKEAILKAEIDQLLKTAEATDEQEESEHGAEADGYRVPEELGRREERLRKIKKAKAALEKREERDHPGEPIDPKKQISFADHDARCFAKQGDGARYIHNVQAAVDMDSQIIVANHIEDSVSDAHAAKSALERMEQDFELPTKLVGDAGYGNKDTLDSCQERGVTAVCATGREGRNLYSNGAKESQEVGKLDSFSYDWGQDSFACPHGHVFVFARERPIDGTRTYKSLEPVRCTCGHYETVDGREVLRVDQSHMAKRELKRIMEEPGNSELYRRRKCTVEPVFGQIKVGMGFRRFSYRGRQNVSSEWNLVCAAFNVKKIASLLAGRDHVNSEQATGVTATSGSVTKRWTPILFLFSGLVAQLIMSTTQWASASFASRPRRLRLT